MSQGQVTSSHRSPPMLLVPLLFKLQIHRSAKHVRHLQMPVVPKEVKGRKTSHTYLARRQTPSSCPRWWALLPPPASCCRSCRRPPALAVAPAAATAAGGGLAEPAAPAVMLGAPAAAAHVQLGERQRQQPRYAAAPQQCAPAAGSVQTRGTMVFLCRHDRHWLLCGVSLIRFLSIL